MSLSSFIRHRSTPIAAFGASLLVWFLFESIQFLYSGRVLDLARMLPQLIVTRPLLAIYVVFHMAMASFGAFIAIPYILKGHRAGLVLGVAYCLGGNTINPLTLLLPHDTLFTPDNNATVLSQLIDILWLLVALSSVILFFLQRRLKTRR